MERYHFFASSCRQFGFNCKSLSELKSDESEPDGALATVLKVLQRIHSMFFDPVGLGPESLLIQFLVLVLFSCLVIWEPSYRNLGMTFLAEM